MKAPNLWSHVDLPEVSTLSLFPPHFLSLFFPRHPPFFFWHHSGQAPATALPPQNSPSLTQTLSQPFSFSVSVSVSVSVSLSLSLNARPRHELNAQTNCSRHAPAMEIQRRPKPQATSPQRPRSGKGMAKRCVHSCVASDVGRQAIVDGDTRFQQVAFDPTIIMVASVRNEK